MARPPRVHVPYGFFHVTQRGNDRRAIFLDDQDRGQYLGILGRWLQEGIEQLHAYCLMSNHVHLLLQAADRPLSAPMQVLGSRYARRFNQRWAHCGHLFQGRFHTTLVRDDAQLIAVVRYIHHNPTRGGLVMDPSDHRWSSHRAYLGLESGPAWLRTRLVLDTMAPNPIMARQLYAELMLAPCTSEIDSEVTPTAHLERLDAKDQFIPLDRILEVVAEHARCSLEDICGGSSARRITAARYAVVVLARSLARVRMDELARMVLHADSRDEIPTGRSS